MIVKKSKNLKFYFFLFLAVAIFVFAYFAINKFEKKTIHKPMPIQLLTNVHPNLPWNFKPVKSNIVIMPGEVTVIEYIVENLGDINTTGIATFAYFPNQFGNYVSKLNCFCYDAQTLNPKQKDKFTLVLLIDPEVTKDSKTKDLKEVTIQFTFFDYKEYKKNKS